MMLIVALLVIVVLCVVVYRQRMNTAWWQDCWENLSVHNRVLREENCRLSKDRDAAAKELSKLSEIKAVLDHQKDKKDV